MNKQVYLVLPTLEVGKIVTYEFSLFYVKPKYREKAKMCYIDADSFTVYIKTDDICKNIAKDIETSFYILNYQFEQTIV